MNGTMKDVRLPLSRPLKPSGLGIGNRTQTVVGLNDEGKSRQGVVEERDEDMLAFIQINSLL